MSRLAPRSLLAGLVLPGLVLPGCDPSAKPHTTSCGEGSHLQGSTCVADNTPPLDADGDGHTAEVDCDDNTSAVYPGATEVCDGIDNDCDGSSDHDAADTTAWYADTDGDGHGAGDTTGSACEAPDGQVATADDCNDNDPAINPAALEVCDTAATDEDCDGLADDADPDVTGTTTWYPDTDGDGLGEGAGADTCVAPPDTVSTGGDVAATVWPGDIAPTSLVAIPVSAWVRGVVDLDGDGVDEVIVEDYLRSRLYLARVDVRDGSAALGQVTTVTDLDEAYGLGNGQVLVAGSRGSYLLTLQLERDGTWSEIDRLVLPEEIAWAGPLGDLDGDGTSDLALQISGADDLVVFRGPLDPDLTEDRRILTLTNFSDTHHGCYTTEAISWGDVNGDGADDLLALSDEDMSLEVIFGPLTLGTVGAAVELAGAVVPLGSDASNCVAGVVDDLDGDGSREVAVPMYREIWLFDGLFPGTSVTEPDQVIDFDDAEQVAPGVSASLAVIGDDGAGWWLATPTVGAWRPDVSTDAPDTRYATFGRFGSVDATDLVWVRYDTLYGAPGTDPPNGADRDRDGWVAPDDCDDTDPRLRPEAPETVDGIDEDCDGSVDESTSALLLEVVRWEGTAQDHNLGSDLMVWDDGIVVWPEAGDGDTVVLADALGGTYEVFSIGGGWKIGGIEAAGDVDGDGYADLLALGHMYTSTLLYGPPAAAEALRFTPALDELSALRGVGDLDGDGFDEVAVWGGYYHDGSVYDRRFTLTFGMADREDTFREVSYEGAAGGGDAAGPLDLDGDGYGDLLISSYGTSTFWLGPLSDAPSDDTADGTFTGDYDYTTIYPGDVDGDGQDDLVVSSRLLAEVSVALGPWTAGAWLIPDVIDTTFSGSGDAGFGTAIAWEPGGAFYIGSTTLDRDAGRVYGFTSGTSGDPVDNAAARVDGVLPRGACGSTLGLGDLDADGLTELVVGCPGEAAPLDDEGVVRIFAGF